MYFSSSYETSAIFRGIAILFTSTYFNLFNFNRINLKYKLNFFIFIFVNKNTYINTRLLGSPVHTTIHTYTKLKHNRCAYMFIIVCLFFPSSLSPPHAPFVLDFWDMFFFFFFFFNAWFYLWINQFLSAAAEIILLLEQWYLVKGVLAQAYILTLERGDTKRVRLRHNSVIFSSVFYTYGEIGATPSYNSGCYPVWAAESGKSSSPLPPSFFFLLLFPSFPLSSYHSLFYRLSRLLCGQHKCPRSSCNTHYTFHAWNV